MARPSKTAAIDYTAAHDLTHGLLERAACPADLPFVLVRDADKKGLRLRVTKAGGKAWQFETRIKGKLFTRALGGWPAVSIDDAKEEAHRLRGLAEKGTDPRELERKQQEAKEQADAVTAGEQARKVEQEARQALTVGEAWAVYLAERKTNWGERHYADHIEKAAPGGLNGRRGKTLPGPLFTLMALPLHGLTAPVIEAWATKEAQTRPTSARLAWRLLKAFLGWCNEQPAYAGLLAGNPAKNKKSREALGKPAVKSDVLQKGQLSAWFAAVHQITNPVVAAALQTMLLTGARPGEVLTLRWDDINLKWKGIQIRDKVEGTREIPATPYLLHLLAALPRRNEFVFAGLRAETIANPTELHAQACAVAGIDGLTLHGLRRSFKSLTEWLEIPAGVVAQLMGHKPSATAEKHYTVRPLDLLRVHHEKIEAWILEQAGVSFDAKAAPGKLRVVAG
jgi:integrase